MKEKWIVQTEKGDCSTKAVWGSAEEAGGRRSTALVLETNSKASVIILAAGMFYLTGPGILKPVLFRVENCKRAAIEGCMFIKAVEAADIVRSKENSILREMRKLLELDILEPAKDSINERVFHSVAS